MSFNFDTEYPGGKQQMFDIVVRGLRAQGWRRSVSNDGICKYINSDGMKCAVGHLIPDGALARRMNYCGKTGNLDKCILEGLVSTQLHEQFLRVMQNGHDKAVHPTFQKDDPAMMEASFRHIALKDNLIFPEC